MKIGLKIGFIHIWASLDQTGWPNLAYGWIKSYLHKYYDNPSVIMERATPETLHEYDVAAFSCISQDYSIAKKYASDAKQKNPKLITIIGGSHISCLPQTLTRDFDFGVIGEGEQTFLEFVKYVAEGQKEEMLFAIPGLVFWRNEQLLFAPPRSFIEPLDRIPPPIRGDLGEQEFYIFSCRGCPYKCTFCSSSAFWKRTTRYHSVDYVVDEIERCIQMGAKNIPIMDDLFIANKNRFREIVEKIEQRDLRRRFNFWGGFSIQLRANLIDDEICEYMRRMNVPIAYFGAESASNRILKLMRKGITAEQNQRAIDVLHDNGFLISPHFIVGWPGETEEELMMTLDFIYKNGALAKKINPFTAIGIVTPLPGTELWNEAIKMGKIGDLNSFDWNRLGIFQPINFIAGFDEWVEARYRNNSIYLNEETLPQKRLYEILQEHYIKMGDSQ